MPKGGGTKLVHRERKLVRRAEPQEATENRPETGGYIRSHGSVLEIACQLQSEFAKQEPKPKNLKSQKDVLFHQQNPVFR